MLTISQLHGITELGAEVLLFLFFEPPTMGNAKEALQFLVDIRMRKRKYHRGAVTMQLLTSHND